MATCNAPIEGHVNGGEQNCPVHRRAGSKYNGPGGGLATPSVTHPVTSGMLADPMFAPPSRGVSDFTYEFAEAMIASSAVGESVHRQVASGLGEEDPFDVREASRRAEMFVSNKDRNELRKITKRVADSVPETARSSSWIKRLVGSKTEVTRRATEEYVYSLLLAANTKASGGLIGDKDYDSLTRAWRNDRGNIFPSDGEPVTTPGVDGKVLTRSREAYVDGSGNAQLTERWSDSRKFDCRRADGKASVTTYRGDGSKVTEIWGIDGLKGRPDDLPSRISYFTDDEGNDRVWQEEWFSHGVRERDGGRPARIHYDESGEVEHVSFYAGGDEIHESWMIARAFDIDPDNEAAIAAIKDIPEWWELDKDDPVVFSTKVMHQNQER